MKYVYVVCIKDENNTITISGVFTSQNKAWNHREQLQNNGYAVTCEKLPVNEDCDRVLNIFSSRR